MAMCSIRRMLHLETNVEIAEREAYEKRAIELAKEKGKKRAEEEYGIKK